MFEIALFPYKVFQGISFSFSCCIHRRDELAFYLHKQIVVFIFKKMSLLDKLNGLTYRKIAVSFLFAIFASTQIFAFENNINDDLPTYEVLKKNDLTDPVYIVEDSFRLEFPDFSATFVKGYYKRLLANDTLNAGFVFHGAGFVDFTPRHEIEKKQLLRFTDKQSFHAEFDYFVLKKVSDATGFVTPGTISSRDEFDNNVVDFVLTAEASLLERLGFNLPSRLLTEIILAPTGFSGCIFRNISEGRVYPPINYYFYDPNSHEQVQFMQSRPKALGKPFYTINRYHLGDYLAPEPESTLRITQYNGWIEIHKNGKITADLGIDIFSGFRRIKLLYFQLSKLLKLEWATSIHGDSLKFIQEKEQTGFTIIMPDTVAPTDTLRLNFHYTGDILEKRNNGNLYLQDPVHWHPRLGYLKRGRYKIVFKYPRDMQLLANGDLLKEWDEGEKRLSYYFQRVPVKASMFVAGKFKKSDFQGPNNIGINIFSSTHRNSKVIRAVNNNIASSLYFYSRNLQPIDYDQIKIIESIGIDSQGFPGFIKLSQIAFRTESGGALAALRSHEIAHQWWGNVVGWRSYRDQWLSESFAEYLGALYLAYILPGTKQFQQFLTAWHDDLLEGGNIGVSLGLKRFGFSKEVLRNSNIEKAGPIYLGVRLGQKESAEYYLLVYQKGAYLLHTLRNYLRDDDSGSDEKFWILLRDYLSKYNGKDPSSKDFIELTSNHAGEDMDWFFDQWLLDSIIPEYSFQYEIVSAEEGYKITGKIQEKVAGQKFKSFIPVSVHFAEAESQGSRFVFTGNEYEFELGPYYYKPIEIEFNSDRAVLARFK